MSVRPPTPLHDLRQSTKPVPVKLVLSPHISNPAQSLPISFIGPTPHQSGLAEHGDGGGSGGARLTGPNKLSLSPAEKPPGCADLRTVARNFRSVSSAENPQQQTRYSLIQRQGLGNSPEALYQWGLHKHSASLHKCKKKIKYKFNCLCFS